MDGDLKEIFAALNLNKALGGASTPTSRISTGPGAVPSLASLGCLSWPHYSVYIFPCQFLCRPPPLLPYQGGTFLSLSQGALGSWPASSDLVVTFILFLWEA